MMNSIWAEIISISPISKQAIEQDFNKVKAKHRKRILMIKMRKIQLTKNLDIQKILLGQKIQVFRIR